MRRRSERRGTADTIPCVNRLGVILAAIGLVMLAGAVVIYRGARPQPTAPATASPPPQPSAVAPPASPPAVAEAPSAPPPPERAPARRPSPARPASTPAPAAPPPAAPETATLTIVSDVPGAQVFLDRRFVGTTPATATDVAIGAHQLNVSAPGFEAHVETIEVTPGPREVSIRFREVRLDAAIDVVHKHRIGSCRGRLVATAQGLRYETQDKDDAFAAPLSGLELFQVDYLAKNLRVQPARGRRYDFTDPEGNADRLFVFHRDVDRARERLKKGDAPRRDRF
jgi:hypothetical protein